MSWSETGKKITVKDENWIEIKCSCGYTTWVSKDLPAPDCPCERS